MLLATKLLTWMQWPCVVMKRQTRLIFLHAQHAVKQGHKSLIVDAIDTDIVIVAPSIMPSLMQLVLEKMRVTFGKGEKTKWIPIHEVDSATEPEKTRGILFFHAFSGCDIVSSFHGKSKSLSGKHGTCVMMS